MIEKIKQYISNLEKEANIKVLLAVESGSRSWGFPSADSDYDVRIIYVHKPEWYYHVSEHRDTIEYMSEDRQFDLSGWELRKALRIMSKTNPGFSDWIFSDVIYLSDPTFLKEMQELHDVYYNPIRAAHHYHSLACKFKDKNLDAENVNPKAFLYFLRSVMNCEYILRNEKHPPVNFLDLIESFDLPVNIKTNLCYLVEEKARQSEKDSGTIAKELIYFAVGKYDEVTNKLIAYKSDWQFPKEELDCLDVLAIKYVNKYKIE